MDRVIDRAYEVGGSLLVKLMDLWKDNKYFRIISICTSSLFATLLLRNVLLKVSWKIQGLPPAYKVGFPGIGIALDLFAYNCWPKLQKPYVTVNYNSSYMYILYCILHCTLNIFNYNSYITYYFAVHIYKYKGKSWVRYMCNNIRTKSS